MMWKAKVFCPFTQVNHPILSNPTRCVAITFVNLGKILGQNEVVGSMYILYKLTW
jgi:hypothetical protein